MEGHSEILKRFSSDIQKRMVYPVIVAAKLYEEGVVSEDLVNEVASSTKAGCPDPCATILSAVGAAVETDPEKLWAFIAVVEEFPAIAPLGRKMRDELRSRRLEGEEQNNY